MEKKNYSIIYSAVFTLGLFSLLLWKLGAFNFVGGLVSKIFSSPRNIAISKISQDKNLDLIKLSNDLDVVKLKSDNQALRDQFASSNPNPSSLMPAKIIGAPTFIPGQTQPDYFILDKGSSDGVKKGDGVIYQSNLIGQISEVSSYSSKVTIINSKSISLTGKLESGAVGVVRGTGDGIEIDNILLSENLNRDMTVLSKGSQDLSGIGVPPDIIIGKIISVDHDPSALFQRAKIQSLVDFTKINTVFVVIK